MIVTMSVARRVMVHGLSSSFEQQKNTPELQQQQRSCGRHNFRIHYSIQVMPLLLLSKSFKVLSAHTYNWLYCYIRKSLTAHTFLYIIMSLFNRLITTSDMTTPQRIPPSAPVRTASATAGRKSTVRQESAGESPGFGIDHKAFGGFSKWGPQKWLVSYYK